MRLYGIYRRITPQSDKSYAKARHRETSGSIEMKSIHKET